MDDLEKKYAEEWGFIESDNGSKRKKISKGKTKDIYVRARGCCERCGKHLAGLQGHIHHRDNDRTNDDISNLILLCPDCHSRIHKHDKPKKEKDEEDDSLGAKYAKEWGLS